MNRRRALVLVELLVVVLIIAALAGLYFGVINKRSPANGGAATTPGKALEKAHGVECANNLNQQRQWLQMKYSEDGQYPPALDASNGMDKCPVGGQPYNYDPQTGQVSCSTPGHQKF